MIETRCLKIVIMFFQMNEYFPKLKSLGGKLKVESHLSNYATKLDLKNATGDVTSKFTS